MTWIPTNPESTTIPGPAVSQEIDCLRLSYEHVAHPDGTHEIQVRVEEGYADDRFVYIRERAGSPFTIPAADVAALMDRSRTGALGAHGETELWTWLVDNGKIPAGAEA